MATNLNDKSASLKQVCRSNEVTTRRTCSKLVTSNSLQTIARTEYAHSLGLELATFCLPKKLVLRTCCELVMTNSQQTCIARRGGASFLSSPWRTCRKLVMQGELTDSALLVCGSFASSLTREICHDKIISSKNQACCKRTLISG
ncbi:hypothetical protein AVEN_224391-1 [Araneus ventricosus]|uniref:Uncharacterized protein n=1 Tax=Araneus ventricosus TaxID=182803 RepID=A0A4Y2FB83_ARAVE|nr:hypothetical protein AVEN_224391-1 [Araneus ventricosus]